MDWINLAQNMGQQRDAEFYISVKDGGFVDRLQKLITCPEELHCMNLKWQCVTLRVQKVQQQTLCQCYKHWPIVTSALTPRHAV